jgi:NADH:ubiquinone oxidoreductase subunit 4 (subunit M)
VIGATGIVLAAMYVLRLVSAVLHQDVGSAVPESALDLRLGELAVVVPLVLCLIGLSAWPNLVSGHAFGGQHAKVQIEQGLEASP